MASSSTSRRSRSRPRPKPRRAPVRRATAIKRRRIGVAIVAGFIAVVALVIVALPHRVDDVITELTLPLRHDDIIRQQSKEKGVDASLIAAVIYSESRFVDQTSSAGARGLMQITKDTALHIEQASGGSTFNFKDLADPDVNIRYGTFYLRELLDRFDGNEVAALAAYNAGPGNADEWGGAAMEVDDIGFPETRAYVDDVLQKKTEYRRKYPKELGY